MVNQNGVKERILESAQQKFMAVGFSKVSVDELVQDLGMSKKTFYKHFDSKQELIGQVLNRLVLTVRSGIAQILDTDRDFIDKLHMMLEFLGKILSRLSRPVQEDLRRNFPDLWERIENVRRDTILRNFSRLFSQGVQQGAFREDVHGNGANIDNLETRDERKIIPETSFSIEPGIYFLERFGVRSELNVFITRDRQVVVTGEPVQQDVIRILE